MGRIKTQLIKRISRKLMTEHGEKFNGNFDDDKKVVSEYTTQSSLKMRNTIAGYVSRLKKKGYDKDYTPPRPAPKPKFDPSERRSSGGRDREKRY